MPGAKSLVRFDDVLDALRALDRQAYQQHGSRQIRPRQREKLNKQSGFREGSDGQGHPLN
jgi:hypothetical protein